MRKRSPIAPPPAVARRGITHAVHVLPDTAAVPNVGRLVWLVFGPQLRERFLRPAPPAIEHSGSDTDD